MNETSFENIFIWTDSSIVVHSLHILDGKLDEMTSEQLHTCRGKKLEIAVYAQM